jgi:hypothetical protein
MKVGGFLACLGLVVVLTPGARGADESGPKAGEKVEALKAFGLIGAVENKEADFAAERKDDPTVYLFVQSEHFGRPMARFIKVLDTEIGKGGDEKAAAVAVWLGDKEATDKNKEYLPRVQMSLKLEKTSIATLGEKSGPNGWGINPDTHLTVVVAHKGKVVKSFPLTSVNETDVRPVLAELKKATGK